MSSLLPTVSRAVRSFTRFPCRRIAYLNDAGERIEENLDDVMVFSATGIVVEFPSGQPIDPAPSAELIPVEITYFVKESGLLTKKIRLAADGLDRNRFQ